MDESRNNELLRIISEILEYTENATPTSTKPDCACGDCGLYYFNDPQMICVKESCSGKDCNTRDCYNCLTGTPPCEDFCECDSGTNCEYCRSDEECVNVKIKKCPKKCPDLRCGKCQPKQTPSPTGTQPCKCLLDCGAQFSSKAACESFIDKGNCPLKGCRCENTSCTCPDGQKNPNCYDVVWGPTPTPNTPTPTNTCPLKCTDSRCQGQLFERRACQVNVNCRADKNDFCVTCEDVTCTGGGKCPILLCTECKHHKKQCGNGQGYPTRQDCEKAIKGKDGWECITCDKDQPNCGKKEECYCDQPVPTQTVCDCKGAAGAGWVERCGAGLPVADVGDFPCPGDAGRKIHCELCGTPTPSSCLCSDITGNCFSEPSSCDTWAQDQEADDPTLKCTCAAPTQKNCPKNQSRYVTCSCGTCTKNTPSPTPTPTISCLPVPGCCTNCGDAAKGVRAKDWSCARQVRCFSTKRRNPDTRCKDSDCFTVTYKGVYAQTKNCGQEVYDPNGGVVSCMSLGYRCTISNQTTCIGRGVYFYVEDTAEVDFGVC